MQGGCGEIYMSYGSPGVWEAESKMLRKMLTIKAAFVRSGAEVRTLLDPELQFIF